MTINYKINTGRTKEVNEVFSIERENIPVKGKTRRRGEHLTKG